MGRRVGVEDEVGGQLGCGPVVEARALGAVAAGESLPGIGRGVLDELVDAPDPGQGLDLLLPSIPGQRQSPAQDTNRCWSIKGEIADHLGYDKHDPAGKNGGNSGNGTRAKTVLTDVGRSR
ncbi:hypothetical protein [Streptomyces tendae]|uniref:hypothetical protein n=1 Tax=Streptomyces tendae TaxID=1932 RepID=UPI003D660CD6